MKLDRYEELIKNLSIGLRNHLIKMGARPEIAEDVVQDIFVKILEMDVILSPNELRPYVYRMAKNRYVDLQRREHRLEDILEKYLIPELQYQDIVDDHDHKNLLLVLAKLKDDQLELLQLKYQDRYSTEEIAKRMNIFSSAVKMRLMRLRRKIKKMIGAETNE